MAALAEGPGLVHAFAEFALLPDLLKLVQTGDAPGDWQALMHEAGLNMSHVLDRDIGTTDPVSYMADDAWRLAERLELVDPTAPRGLTQTGRTIAEMSPNPPRVRSDPSRDTFGLRVMLGGGIESHYQQTHGILIAQRLRDAVRGVARIDSLWTRYLPGLLLAEFDFVLSELTHGRRPWPEVMEELQNTRNDVVRLLGEPVGRLGRRNAVDFADAVSAFHWQGMPAAPPDRMTVTAARANAMLFAFANILDQGAPLGPAQHLTLPRPAQYEEVKRPEPTRPLAKGAILVGAEEAAEWLPPITNDEAIVRLYELGRSDFRTNELIYERLGIDVHAREQAGNQLPLGDTERELHDGRWMNKALAMELLSSVALSAIDSPDQVRSFCIERDGRPNYFAPSGKLDILASYPASGSRAPFAIAAEVSSKRKMSVKEYKDQLRQGVKHARELLAENQQGFSVVYVLVANVRDICNDREAWDAYREVVEETGVGSDHRIRLLPMYAKDLAYAAERVNDAYWDEPARFAPDALAMALDEQFALLASDDALDDAHAVRAIWDRVEDPGRFRDLFALAAPEAPRQAPKGPSPN